MDGSRTFEQIHELRRRVPRSESGLLLTECESVSKEMPLYKKQVYALCYICIPIARWPRNCRRQMTSQLRQFITSPFTEMGELDTML